MRRFSLRARVPAWDGGDVLALRVVVITESVCSERPGVDGGFTEEGS